MTDIVTLSQSSEVMQAAKTLAVRVLIACNEEYKNRASTLDTLRGEHGDTDVTMRDAMRVAKSLSLISTSGKWGQWVKVNGRLNAFSDALLTMRVVKHKDESSAMAKCQRQVSARHSAAVNLGASTRQGNAFLSVFRSIITTVKAVSFNGSTCGHARRDDGLLDSLIYSANDLLNYDLGGLDGGTCSEALSAVQEAYRQS